MLHVNDIRLPFQEPLKIAFTWCVLSHYTFHHHLDSTVAVMHGCGYIICSGITADKPPVASCSATGLCQSASML